ncbi:F5/8 type C domain protein [Planctomyces sp. SH-PL62]|nr:F5/8 type C domain protein [Planctomyces sp. SH-PL62]
MTGVHAGQWRMIAAKFSDTEYLLTEPLPLGDYVISIGRGLVNATIRGNEIDTTGRHNETVGLVITNNAWGTRVLDNTFVGNNSLRIQADATQEYPPGSNPSQVIWGKMLMPVFDLTVDGNTFRGNTGVIGVSHDKASTVGRTYLTGRFTNNKFIREGGSGTGMQIGLKDYAQSAHPWITPGALRLTTQNNWWADASAGGEGTILVTAALVDGVGSPLRTINLPGASLVTGLSRGQDGRDFIGSGSSSTGPDGFQDVHLVLSGLPEGKTISKVKIDGQGGGTWWFGDTGTTDKAVLVRNGTTADLYIQPYQNETGRYFTINITYTDAPTPPPVVISSIHAMAKLPMLANRVVPSGIVTARGSNPGGGEGAAQAFDGTAQTKWLDFAGSSWIQYQFAAGAAHVVTQYTITSANDTATFPTRAPESWILKGSNDGANWTILDSRRGEAITANFTSRTYRFSNTTAFKYYKFDDILAGKDANGDRGSVIQVGEIALQTSRVLAVKAGSATVAGWGDDAAHASGGNFYSTGQFIDVSAVVDPAPQSIYQNERNGNFTYTISGLAPGGKYKVRLHFAENYWTAPGQRTFNVAVNGSLALDHFDILAAAGGQYKAVVREIDATADSLGRIVVNFDGTGQPDQPKVGGVEVVIPNIDLARGKSVTSLINESSSFGPGNVVDGDETTRWSSGQWSRNNQIAWLVIDLGARFDIDRVRLNWEAAFGVDYQIQVSDDGSDWTMVRDVVGATTGGVVEHANLKAGGRYVRIYMTRSRINPTNNFSIYSVNVHGA